MVVIKREDINIKKMLHMFLFMPLITNQYTTWAEDSHNAGIVYHAGSTGQRQKRNNSGRNYVKLAVQTHLHLKWLARIYVHVYAWGDLGLYNMLTLTKKNVRA